MESGVATYLAKTRRGKIRWRLLDADGWVLGRLAAQASRVLTGKAAADFTPHVDHRDGVIIINAEKIRLTGKKLDDKIYRHYTGYPGGLREISARRVMATRPERIIREAIRGMLPKTHLGDRMAVRLKVYAGAEHPHSAQKPEALTFSR
jgi:large subunit ribosomal protein L13